MASIIKINEKSVDDISKWDEADLSSTLKDINGLSLKLASTIVIDFDGSTTYLSNSPGDVDGYQGIVFSGRQSGDIIDISLTVECTISGTGSVAFDYRINSGTWVQLGSYSSSQGTTSKSVPNVDHDDTVDIRIDCGASGLGTSVSGTASLTGGTFDSGSGTISASGTTTFTLSTSI